VKYVDSRRHQEFLSLFKKRMFVCYQLHVMKSNKINLRINVQTTKKVEEYYRHPKHSHQKQFKSLT